jgi:hypothetical protein
MTTVAFGHWRHDRKRAFPRRFKQIGLFATLSKLPEIKEGESGLVGDILFATELVAVCSSRDRARPNLTSH